MDYILDKKTIQLDASFGRIKRLEEVLGQNLFTMAHAIPRGEMPPVQQVVDIIYYLQSKETSYSQPQIYEAMRNDGLFGHLNRMTGILTELMTGKPEPENKDRVVGEVKESEGK